VAARAAVARSAGAADPDTFGASPSCEASRQAQTIALNTGDESLSGAVLAFVRRDAAA
jgi:hypothetical protein